MAKSLQLIAIAAMLGSASLMGATTVEESFGYATGALDGSSGGTGFGGAWGTAVAVGPGSASVSGSSLSAGTLAVSGGSALLASSKSGSNDGSVTISRSLTTALTSNPNGSVTVQPYYISFVADLDDNLFTQVSDAGQRQWGTGIELKLVDTAGSKTISLGKQGGAASFNLASTGLPGVGVAGSAIGSSPVLMVLKVKPQSWDITNFSLWVNPSSLGGAEPATALTASTNIGFSIDHVELTSYVSGWMPVTTLNHSIDEIRIGGSWADVTPVPEPMTVGVFGLAALAVLRRRRA